MYLIEIDGLRPEGFVFVFPHVSAAVFLYNTKRAHIILV